MTTSCPFKSLLKRPTDGRFHGKWVSQKSDGSPDGLMQEILVVEDSDTDAELLERALRAAEVMNPVRRFADGHQALAYFIPWKAGPSAGFTGYCKSVSGTLGRGTCSEN